MWVAVLISPFYHVDRANAQYFQDKSRVIEDMYNRFLSLNRVKIRGVQKLTVTVSNDAHINDIHGPIKGFSPVVNITKSFDFQLFSSLDSTTQNEMILDLIQSSIVRSAKELGWNSDLFNTIPDQIRKANFENRFVAGKMISSKNRAYKAGVEVDMRMDCAVLSVVFYSREEFLRRIELIRVRPYRLLIAQLVSRLRWVTEDEVEVINKGGDILFVASFKEGKSRIRFASNSKTEDELIDELLMASVVTEPELAIKILKEKINRTK